MKWTADEKMYFNVTMLLLIALIGTWLCFGILFKTQEDEVKKYEDRYISMCAELEEKDGRIAELEDQVCGYCELLNEATDQLKEQYEVFEECSQYLESVDKDRGRTK